MKARLIFALLLGSLLVACSADMGELNQWMEQQKREAKPTIKPLVPPKKFLPQPYEAASAGVDPYSPQKLSVAIKQEAAQPNSLLSAEMNRRREPLESYPLDSMSMVGSMMRQGQRYALLRADNLLYRVKDGEHLGLNFGRVMKISETDITLREVVQDAAGEWVERTSTLQLQEQGR